MTDARYTGGCLCGAVRYEATGKATNRCFCHCASCRRAAGAPMVPWATFGRDLLRITRGRLVEHRSSPEVVRGFCGTCGTSLTYRHDGRPNEVDLALATLDDPATIAPRAHIWVRDKVPWVTITDGLPQFETIGGS